MDISQEPFCKKFTGKRPPQSRGPPFVCERAQSKRTWTFHKSHFVPILRGPRFVRACAVETHMDISQEPFCAEMYGRNAARDSDHLD